ncbi:MAG: alpha-amylase C-terminal beta-sheet domain-containing protein, partial [Candidatus Methylacidiphilales bacterium]|nr:alpha-amylase C-terminal beta-sheet domain-containing protein [Candidatus Methylacidiphilales bacterium]
WKHYFDWGKDLQSRIKALINARKVAGIHAASYIHTQDLARKKGVYGAEVLGNAGKLYVRIGGDNSSWTPGDSGYSNYRSYAKGEGWEVWIALPGNPEPKEAPLNRSLGELPELVKLDDIVVKDSDVEYP